VLLKPGLDVEQTHLCSSQLVRRGLPHGLWVQWGAVVAVGYDVAALNRFETG